MPLKATLRRLNDVQETSLIDRNVIGWEIQREWNHRMAIKLE